MTAEAAAGLTVRDVAKRYRISPDKVRALIRAGRLGAINTNPVRCAKPRFVILPDHLKEFEQQNRAATPHAPVPRRRKRQDDLIDFYPD